MPGLAQQRIVCRVAGNPAGSRLWWFVDDCAAGTTEGDRPFVLALAPGVHTVVCSTATGETASVSIAVTDGSRRE